MMERTAMYNYTKIIGIDHELLIIIFYFKNVQKVLHIN